MAQNAVDAALAQIRRQAPSSPTPLPQPPASAMADPVDDIDTALETIRRTPDEPARPPTHRGTGVLTAVEQGRAITPADMGASAGRALDTVTSLPGVSHLFRALRAPQQALVVGPATAIADALKERRGVRPAEMARASAKAVRQDLSFKTAAEAAGFSGKAATIGGLIGDLVLDPLWLATPAKMARAAKLPELMRSVPVQRALTAAADTRAGRVAGKALIPDFGKPADYVALAETHSREVQQAVETAHDLGRRINALPTDSQRAVRELMEAGSDEGREAVLARARAAGLDAEPIQRLGDEAMTRDIELGRALTDVGLMTEETFEKWRGRHIRREYRKHINPHAYLDDLATRDPEAAARLEGQLKQRAGFTTETAPLRERLAFLKQRKDIPEDLRAAMGEILEAGGPVGRGQALAGTAIARRGFLTRVAQDFASDTMQPGYKFAGDTKALGPLRGKYLPDTIAEDVDLVLRRPGQAERLWKRGVGLWKMGKTAYNPATHARNVLSNLVLADMAGLAPYKVHRYATALHDLTTNGKWTQEAQAAGAQFFANTFAGVELGRLGELTSDAGRLRLAWHKVARVLEKPARLYQAEEQFFKLAFYIDQRMKGIDPQLAVKASEQALFDYRKVPRLIDELRTWGVVPFASFPYFAAQATGRALAHRPAAVSRYGHLFRVFEDRESSARERNVLPRYMRDGWIRLPGTDAEGRVRYVNGQYILPFGDLSELAQLNDPSNKAGMGRAVGQRMPLVQLGAAIVTGVDPFSGREIDQQPGGWRTWLLNFALSLLAGGYASRELKAAVEGRPMNPLSRHDEPRTLGQAALANFAGIRIRPVNLDEERHRRIEELTYEIRDIQTEMRRYQRSKWLSEPERLEALGEQMQRVRTLLGVMEPLKDSPPPSPPDIDSALAQVRARP